MDTAPLEETPTERPKGNEVVGDLARLGRGPVQDAADPIGGVEGGEYAHVVAASEKLLGECLNVPVHASLVAPGIWRDKGDPHWQ